MCLSAAKPVNDSSYANLYRRPSVNLNFKYQKALNLMELIQLFQAVKIVY